LLCCTSWQDVDLAEVLLPNGTLITLFQYGSGDQVRVRERAGERPPGTSVARLPVHPRVHELASAPAAVPPPTRTPHLGCTSCPVCRLPPPLSHPCWAQVFSATVALVAFCRQLSDSRTWLRLKPACSPPWPLSLRRAAFGHPPLHTPVWAALAGHTLSTFPPPPPIRARQPGFAAAVYIVC
jgi:hypothetical protein